ncbi:RNA chaperone ProQ [Idiomarina tyrosinivorans]|uniref:RNA chaperone ProQ n=1 Tax=Idiomarina tyrosinivorans TaxID=1445662 RepID=A0A432ZTS4_9GAMM|nr:RNA chaperone ProQ [Idiomarina tyrosinivorans]RUO81289.1 RNA chaperone ProQ [Idiomarina tyrosinivorans]
MTDSEKLTKSKDIIAYLAEQFPECFSISGDAKPLKIGIFEDLAARLADDDKVSKTRLRTALRHYTNSWRYLRSVKVGSQRVNLAGEPVAAVEEEHQQHAQETLKESRAKAAERKKAQGGTNDGDKTNSEQKKRRTEKARPPKRATAKPHKVAKPKAPKLKDVELSALSVGQQVQVKAGQSPMPGVIVEIDRDDVQVRLNNGLTMKVKAENVFLTANA